MQSLMTPKMSKAKKGCKRISNGYRLIMTAAQGKGSRRNRRGYRKHLSDCTASVREIPIGRGAQHRSRRRIGLYSHYLFFFDFFLEPVFPGWAVWSGKNPPASKASRPALEMCLKRSPCNMIPPYHLLTMTIAFLISCSSAKLK